MLGEATSQKPDFYHWQPDFEWTKSPAMIITNTTRMKTVKERESQQTDYITELILQ